MSAVAPRLFDAPLAGLYPVSVVEANQLLVLWEHKLGPCERPFHQEAFVLELAGRPIAVAISASIVHGPVGGYRTQEVVELARQAACEPWANRVMIRLWREACAPLWPCWPVKAAISYHHEGIHTGNLYRFDGWEKIKEGCGSMGGGGWSRQRHGADVIAGPKTLWLWRYEQIDEAAA